MMNLNRAVEERWPTGHITRGGQGREESLVARRPWGIGDQFVKIEGAFRSDEMMPMLAAAVCAPDLWALVKAATYVIRPMEALGKTEPGSDEDRTLRRELLSALVQLGLVLARLPEEVDE